MKILIYIKLIFLVFFSCKNNSKKTENIDSFSIQINFIGNIDKPLPTLNFFNSCEENFILSNYNYELNYHLYSELKREIEAKYSAINENSSLIHIILNKKQNYYLNKKSSLSFISKLLNITEYKNNEQLKNQLNLYLRVLKSR